MFRLWNYKLNHYQYYSGGEEVVELRDKNAVRSYLRNHKGDYRLDMFIGGKIFKTGISIK